MTFMNISRRRTAIAAVSVATVLSGTVHAADIHVLATGALSGAFKTLVPVYEQQSGNKLIISWGPSYGASPDALPMRIKNGEAMDVGLMIGAALDDQIKKGNFIADTRADLAESGIGVAVTAGLPKPDISTAEALRRTLLAAKSIAFSEGASGTYITGTLFKELGIVEQVKEKSVLIKGKELVGNAVERGEAELALQQISELRAIPGIQYVGPLPKAVQQVSLISAAVATGARERAAAESLVAFLKSPAAAALLTKSGLDPLKQK